MRAAPAWGASTEQDFACFPTLACHGGLIHRQFTGQQVPVRRDLLAGGKRDDIPADNVLRRDLPHAFLPGGVRSPDTADSACADPDSRAYAASEPCSDSVEISVAKKTASAMPPVSNQSAPRKANSRFSPRAHSRMRMTGSPRLARNLRQKPRRGFFASGGYFRPGGGCFHFGGGQGMGMCRTRRNGGAGQRLHTVSSFLGENLRGCRRIVPAGARR